MVFRPGCGCSSCMDNQGLFCNIFLFLFDLFLNLQSSLYTHLELGQQYWHIRHNTAELSNNFRWPESSLWIDRVCCFWTVEALHLGTLMAAHGYFFPISDHVLTLKDDGTFYRFQVMSLIPDFRSCHNRDSILKRFENAQSWDCWNIYELHPTMGH